MPLIVRPALEEQPQIAPYAKQASSSTLQPMYASLPVLTPIMKMHRPPHALNATKLVWHALVPALLIVRDAVLSTTAQE